jgi:hypothetical protein
VDNSRGQKLELGLEVKIKNRRAWGRSPGGTMRVHGSWRVEQALQPWQYPLATSRWGEEELGCKTVRRKSYTTLIF